MTCLGQPAPWHALLTCSREEGSCRRQGSQLGVGSHQSVAGDSLQAWGAGAGRSPCSQHWPWETAGLPPGGTPWPGGRKVAASSFQPGSSGQVSRVRCGGSAHRSCGFGGDQLTDFWPLSFWPPAKGLNPAQLRRPVQGCQASGSPRRLSGLGWGAWQCPAACRPSCTGDPGQRAFQGRPQGQSRPRRPRHWGHDSEGQVGGP